MSGGCRAYNLAQILDLGEYKPAIGIWFNHCDTVDGNVPDPFETPTPSTQPPPVSADRRRCCYPGCCFDAKNDGGPLIQVCAENHAMHAECFYTDLTEKLKFPEGSYICYQCDDKTLDTLYRALVHNANLRSVFPIGLTQAGASSFAAVQAVAVGSEEYAAAASFVGR